METRTHTMVRRFAFVLLCLALCTGYFGCGGGSDSGDDPDPQAEPMSDGPTALVPRDLMAKPASTLLTDVHNGESIFVKFMDDTGVRLLEGWPAVPEVLLDGTLMDALAYVEGGTWVHAHPIGDAVLDEVRETAQRNSGKAMADFTVMFILGLPAGAESSFACDAFNASEVVELAWPMRHPVENPLPPDYVSLQGYLDDATDGIGAARMWQQCANRGAGIKIADVEYSWNLSHVDLPSGITVLPVPTGVPDYSYSDDHGTAVLGEMAGLDNGFGVTGACPDATIYVVPANYLAPMFYNPAGAITTATAALGPGDIILLEQQTTGPGPNAGYVPIEYYTGVRAAIQTAVAAGIIVVEAAGNGNQDLDDAKFGGFFAIDSGAIIVGGGAPPGHADGDRSRLTYSTYGATVDLQGWGDGVMTTGYGTWYSAEGKNLWYRRDFAGTSSASPNVAAACALLQSTTIARTGTPLTPAQVRSQLMATASPQLAGTNPVAENIGGRPDVPATIGCLEITCPADITLECTSPTGASHVSVIPVTDYAGAALTVDIRVDGVLQQTTTFAASPPTSGGTINFSHMYACCSSHTVEVEARSVIGAIETCTFDVTVQDTMNPVITCPGTVTVECDGAPGRVVTFTGASAATAADVCDPAPMITYVPPSGSTFMLGTTSVTATATDAAGNSDFCTFDVIVEDTTAPVVTATARRLYLFLPRNGMIDVVLERTASDVCDPSPTMQVEVWSSQPDTGAPFTPDGAVVASDLQLRAEVDLADVDPGRVFLVLVTATDASSNVGRKSTWVIVPKTATAQDIVGARNIAVAAQSDYDSSSTIPAGWTQVLAPTLLP